MKRDDIVLLAAVVIVAAVLSFVVSSSFIKYSQQTNSVPVVENINSSLPDAYNDPAYKNIFNSNAIDPTQLTHIGNQRNGSPFRGTN